MSSNILITPRKENIILCFSPFIHSTFTEYPPMVGPMLNTGDLKTPTSLFPWWIYYCALIACTHSSPPLPWGQDISLSHWVGTCPGDLPWSEKHEWVWCEQKFWVPSWMVFSWAPTIHYEKSMLQGSQATGFKEMQDTWSRPGFNLQRAAKASWPAKLKKKKKKLVLTTDLSGWFLTQHYCSNSWLV